LAILLFVLLVILIAAFGFWDTLAAIVGAAVMVALAVLLGLGVLGVGAYLLLKRGKG
jgi:hypothetical protein